MVWTAAYGVQKNMKARLLSVSLVVGLLLSMLAQALPQMLGIAHAAATQTEQKVFQSDFANTMDTWTYHDDIKDSSTDISDKLNAATPNAVTGVHEIAARPKNATFGNNGAVKLTAASGQKWNLASLQYSGTKLKDITALGFDIYTDKPGQAYINLDVNFNSWDHGPGSWYHGRLVYVPQGVVSEAWSSHEATTGGLWRWSSSNTWPDGVAGARTWESIKKAFPNAHISSVPYELGLKQPFGSLYLRADGEQGPVTTYFDNVYLATANKNIKYNFELENPDPENRFGLTTGAIVYQDHALNDCFNKTSCENRGENMEDWEMRLYKEDSSGNWQFVQSRISDANGRATFSRQPDAGTYHVCEVLKAGWTQQIQNWPGTPYHIVTPNLSGDSTEGPYCRTISYADTGSHSNVAYFGNVDTSNDDSDDTGPTTNPAGEDIEDDTDSVQSDNNASNTTDGDQPQAQRTNVPAPQPTLAATTTTDDAVPQDQQNIAVAQNTNPDEDEDAEEVAGASTGTTDINEFASVGNTLGATATNEATGCSKILGLCWYYWPPIILAVILTGYYLYSRRETENV